MTYRPSPGTPAPLLCWRCKVALWWRPAANGTRPVLVDVRNRVRCRPLARFGGYPHAMTKPNGGKS
jgi:hypothetical protein